MCGRFALTVPPEAMLELFDAEPAEGLPAAPRYNICPTQQISVVVAREEGRFITPMRWGFIPHWYKAAKDGPLLINARAETVADKPAFRAACRSRRCLVPASGFFEWQKRDRGAKQPWYIFAADGGLLAFAGIWQGWADPESGHHLETVAIVTTGANGALAPIHNRMPVIIASQDFPLWLGEDGTGAAALLAPAADDSLAFYEVRQLVNNMRNDGQSLVEPLTLNNP